MDFDGRVDVTTFYENNKPIKKELETQFDGKPDVIKHYKKYPAQVKPTSTAMGASIIGTLQKRQLARHTR